MGCITSKRKMPTKAVSVEPTSYSQAVIHWLDPEYRDKKQTEILKPHQLESKLRDPPTSVDENVLDHIRGSLIGLALGDALGAHVEFRPHQYMLEHPVTDLQGGGTWGLEEGQFTDDTSMALCLAISLIVSHGYNAYDQLVRYKWWYRNGYMSSTGQCFDIGSATRHSIEEFERRQNVFTQKYSIPLKNLDYLRDENILRHFQTDCGKTDAAGNGGLMRLAPIPLFFFRYPHRAVQYSGESAQTTHGDRKSSDACRFYGALIVAAIYGESKKDLLSPDFYERHTDWFGNIPIHDDVMKIMKGSYKQKNGYEDGIRGKGYVVESLKAALWAFWSDENSFEKGVLAAVNLGDDTDTTAAIYGQLAGACYGYRNLPKKWVERVYARRLITCLSKWIAYEGQTWYQKLKSTSRTHNHQVSKL